jgi:CTP synthase (UTP-ammonia lyase)
MPALTVNVLIDLPPEQRYHAATVAALGHAASAIGVDAHVRIVHTSAIDRGLVRDPGSAVVIGPGSPYEDPDAVHEVVRSARERGVPLVGT